MYNETEIFSTHKWKTFGLRLNFTVSMHSFILWLVCCQLMSTTICYSCPPWYCLVQIARFRTLKLRICLLLRDLKSQCNISSMSTNQVPRLWTISIFPDWLFFNFHIKSWYQYFNMSVRLMVVLSKQYFFMWYGITLLWYDFFACSSLTYHCLGFFIWFWLNFHVWLDGR